MRLEIRENTELKNALKLANLVYSGGEAKHLIKDGAVKLNGEIETRVSKILFDGDVIEFNGEEITVSII